MRMVLTTKTLPPTAAGKLDAKNAAWDAQAAAIIDESRRPTVPLASCALPDVAAAIVAMDAGEEYP